MAQRIIRGNEQPKMEDLEKLVIPYIATDWQKVANELLHEKDVHKLIQTPDVKEGGGASQLDSVAGTIDIKFATAKARGLMKMWLNNPDYKATWNNLIVALGKVGLSLAYAQIAGAIIPEIIKIILVDILKRLGHEDLQIYIEALWILYNYLSATHPELIDAVSKGAKDVIDNIVDICRTHNEIVQGLTELTTKCLLRKGALKVGTKIVMGLGTATATSRYAEMTLNNIPVAMLAIDFVQLGLEYYGYKKVGKAVGMWGNICTGAIASSMIAGVDMAPLGALAGFGIWAVGEGVAKSIEEKRAYTSLHVAN